MSNKENAQPVSTNSIAIRPLWNNPNSTGEDYYRKGEILAYIGNIKSAISSFERAKAYFEEALNWSRYQDAQTQIRRLHNKIQRF